MAFGDQIYRQTNITTSKKFSGVRVNFYKK